MLDAFIGVVFLGVAIFFHEKKMRRLKSIAYIIAIIFLALGSIEVWVGDFRVIFGY